MSFGPKVMDHKLWSITLAYQNFALNTIFLILFPEKFCLDKFAVEKQIMFLNHSCRIIINFVFIIIIIILFYL